MDRDSNLLFGVFAVQLGKVTSAQLADAAASWTEDPSHDLSTHLVRIGALPERDRDILAALAGQAIQEHAGDAGAALVAFGGKEQVRRTFLGRIALDEPGAASQVDQGATVLCESTPASVPAVQESPGRYTHVSEYGRGGMGRILLVHDGHLGRDIALKELLPQPDNGTGDGPPSPVRLSVPFMARFLQEARITGQLEHPSIVPVYELGHRDDGSLYYTMKLVRGRTLRDAIRKAPSFEERLRLLPHFVDLCQAIAYAHSRGVLHRDIKPGNIMVGEFGETVVLDWGLAKVKGREDVHAEGLAETLRVMNLGDEAAAHETVYGQALGTPAYMPPEQAQGKLDAIDERSDVYSLGAVLYELLTAAIPFSGRSMDEILRQVTRSKPKPIRDYTPKAPPELVAICDRAMQKGPANRYASAKELADEVERFLTGAIVQAYEYGTVELLRRFITRHKALVISSLTALLIIVAMTALYVRSIRLAQERERTQRELAEKQKGIALEAINRLTYDIPERLKDVPEALGVLRESMEENVAILDRILALSPDTPLARREKAVNYVNVGDRWLLLGETKKAEDAFTSALSISQDLVALDPSQRQYEEGLYIAHERLGKVRLALGQSEEALQMCETAKGIAQRLADTYGDTDALLTLSYALNHLGEAYVAVGRTGDAESSFLGSLKITQSLNDSNPENKEIQRDLSISLEKIGDINLELGRPDLALEAYRRGMALAEARAASEPDSIEAQRDLALGHDDLGMTCLRLEQFPEALSAFEAAFAIAKRLADAAPDNLEAQGDLAVAYDRLGSVFLKLGQTDEALAALKEAVVIAGRRVTSDPENAEVLGDLVASNQRLGDAYLRAERTEEALNAYEEARASAARAAETDPRNAGARRSLSVCCNKVGDALLLSERTDDALKAYQDGLVPAKALAEENPQDANRQRDLGASYYKLMLTHRLREDRTAWREAGARCVQQFEKAHELAPDDPRSKQDFMSALCEYSLGLLVNAETAAQDVQEGLALAKRLVALSDNSDPNHLDVLALAYFMNGDVMEAAETERAALELLPDDHADPGMRGLRERLQRQLDQYEAAAAGTGGAR